MMVVLKNIYFIIVLCSIIPLINSQRMSKITRFIRKIPLDITKVNNDYDAFLKLLDPIMIKRVSDTPGNKIVREYLSSQMESYGWIVKQKSYKAKTPLGQKTFVNVVADLPIGSHFINADEETLKSAQFDLNNRIVFACHYDSKYIEEYDFIGAIDSAVPCALMLDLAKFLQETFNKNDFRRLSRHLQFLFFDGEEAFKEWTATDSIYGARSHAEDLYKSFGDEAFDRIDLFVLLDLLGGKVSQFPNYFSATSNTYRILARIENMLIKNKLLKHKKNYYFAGQTMNGGVQDDHLPFLHKNVPILHLIPVPFPDQWHNEKDTFENLDHSRIKDLRLILRVFLMQILNVST